MRELLQYEYSRTLNQIADFLEIAHGSNNKVVTGITLNSQKIESGDLFIALQGAKTHGIQFMGDVVAAGAAAILTDEPGFEIVREQMAKRTDSPVVLTSKNLRGALGPLSSCEHDCNCGWPISNLPKCGNHRSGTCNGNAYSVPSSGCDLASLGFNRHVSSG